MCFAARNNIGVVVALWAPIILVWVYVVPDSHPIFNIRSIIIWLFLFFYRFTLWIPKFGMPYSQPYLVGFMVHSVAWERSVIVHCYDHLYNDIFWIFNFFCLFIVFIFWIYFGSEEGFMWEEFTSLYWNLIWSEF